MCSAAQVVQNRETQKSLLAAVVGYIPGTQDMAVEFTVPLGVILPPGIRLQVDESEEIGRAPYLMCTPQGCTGIWKLEAEAVAAMKKGLTLKVIVLNSQQRPVAVPVSLRGFTAAYNTLVQKGP
jgi:invasion protein IalB